MAAKVHFIAYCILDPDTVEFVANPSLFNVNKKAPFSISGIFTKIWTNFLH